MTCTIENANHEDGFWIVRAYVQNGSGLYSSDHKIEGDVDMTDQALQAAVMEVYA
jgi:hypothetical protein